MSHMLDYQVFDHKIAAHHIVSVGLHIFNSILLFLLLRRMTGAHWRSGLVAALFALHPLHVESVAWLSERKDVLSTAFLFLTFGAYHAYAQCKKGGETQTAQRASLKAGLKFYLFALLFLALGLMCKPMLVTTPFVLLLLDYWPLRRLSLEPGQFTPTTLTRLLIEKVPFFLLTVASSVITFLVQKHGGAVSNALTLGQRLSNGAVSYVRYLGKMLWPNELAVLYPHPGSWPIWAVAGAGLLLVLFTALAVYLARSRPYVPVGWFWFLGTLVPVIGIIQVGIQAMADRYSYVPLIGIFIIIAWGAWDLAQRFHWRPEALGVCSALALIVCAFLTLRQVTFWENTETLFRRAVEVEPKNYLAYNNLGYYMANRNRLTEAIDMYQKSLDIKPDYVDALNNMGHALAGLHRDAEAIPFYETALRTDPNHVEVHNNLGNALSDVGRLDEAIPHYEIALRRKPDHAEAHNNLGIALAMKGQLDQALPHFREAIRLKRNYANAHSNLGNAYAVQQKWAEAISEYEECLKMSPDDAQGHNNLANVLVQQGKADLAIPHYQRAVALNANNPEAHFNWGIALVQLNKREEARQHFVEALRLKPDYVQAQQQLAALSQGK